jgi:hypothetical protein
MIKADQIQAKRVTINTGAVCATGDVDTAKLPIGTVFTIINNTAHTAIAGTFSTLLDGGTVTLGPNTYQASYEGGDGNDLTLTVVP